MPTPTPNQAREAVYNHFLGIWNDAALLFVDNELANPPDDKITPWARFNWLPDDAPQRTIGRGRWAQTGSVIVQIFTGLDRRTSESDNLADIVKAAFVGKRTSNPTVHFYDNRTDTIGDEGNWWQVNVGCRFRYMEVP